MIATVYTANFVVKLWKHYADVLVGRVRALDCQLLCNTKQTQAELIKISFLALLI